MSDSHSFDPASSKGSGFAGQALFQALAGAGGPLAGAGGPLAGAGGTLAYAGEGPEIGKSYGYKITGFVTHEPLRRIERLKRALQELMAHRPSARQVLSAAAIAAAAGRSRPGRRRPPTLSRRSVWRRLNGRSTGAPMFLQWQRLVMPALQRAAYVAVRYPATLLALMLACFLGSLIFRGDLLSVDEPSEAALELRLTTGATGSITTRRGDGSAARPEAWKAAKGRSLPIFALEAPELSALMPSYTVRTRAEARDDGLAWSEQRQGDQNAGTSWSLAPLVLIVAQRQLGPDIEPSSLYLDLTRRASEFGLSVMRSAISSDLPTKFGPMEVADVILSADAATPEEQSRSCLAFRQTRDPSFFRLAGWLCAPRDRVVERPTLAALIDRLSLIGASNDARLHQIFVDADLARAATVRVARKPLPWLDQAGEKPQLKGERTPKAAKRS